MRMVLTMLILGQICFAQALDKLPTFKITDFEGGVRSHEEFLGKPLLLDFWATWCRNCAFSVPKLNEIHHEYGSKGLQVVGVSIDESEDRKVRRFLKKYPMNYQVLWDPEKSLEKSLEFESLPTLFLFDKKGQLVLKQVGYEAHHFETLNRLLDSLTLGNGN